jgi:DNA-binding transcriptional ArsR family regulator
MAQLKDFMISRVRVKLFEIFYGNPQEMLYVRELTRQTGEEINAVRRELFRMEKSGLIKSEKRGNRLYYYINQSYDFFEDLLSLVAKSTGMGQDLRDNRKKLGKVKFALLSGKFVRRKHRTPNDVDLLVVGDIVLPELSLIVQKEESARQTEINYTIMTEQEFIFRKNRRDPFLLSILSQSRFMIIGDEEGLVDKAGEENQEQA